MFTDNKHTFDNKRFSAIVLDEDVKAVSGYIMTVNKITMKIKDSANTDFSKKLLYQFKYENGAICVYLCFLKHFFAITNVYTLENDLYIEYHAYYDKSSKLKNYFLNTNWMIEYKMDGYNNIDEVVIVDSNSYYELRTHQIK